MENTDTDNNTNFYEVGYLLSPRLPEKEAAEAEADLHDEITSSDGEIVASQAPEMRQLSYEIEVKEEGEKIQYSRGQFGWVQFSFKPEDVDEVETLFSQNDDVIRHLLITVDADDLASNEDEEEEEEEA